MNCKILVQLRGCGTSLFFSRRRRVRKKLQSSAVTPMQQFVKLAAPLQKLPQIARRKEKEMKELLNREEWSTAKILRVIFLVLMDCVCVCFSTFFALFTRFEFDFKALKESAFLDSAAESTGIGIACAITIFFLFKLYSSLWEFAGAEEFIRLVTASAAVAAVQWVLMKILTISLPRSFSVLFFLFLAITVFCVRFSYRVLRHFRRSAHGNKYRRTMVIGAGAAGFITIRELNSSERSENKVLCVIDDDMQKHGKYIKGVKIVGGRDKIVEFAEKFYIDDIIFAIPTATNTQRKEIFDICSRTKCTLKTIPGLYQLSNGEVSVNQIRKIEIEDLLGREPVCIDMQGIENDLSGATVLVTGGGGSIGSELCRQLSGYAIERLIIFDIYENNAYEIQQELLRDCPQMQKNLKVLIGSVRDEERIDWIFRTYHPNFVFHAAAHKHVPLMEESPCEAVKNNIFGTLNVAKAAEKYGAKRFLLISTDKAVNPTSVMGASKRVCEMIIQSMNRRCKNTDFVAVRFGNVLGSNGSVIPLFKKQIEKGGPVTVTHPDIIRYFMTIPEAVSLILQAGVYAEGGEIFVLDMGEPVKIDHLARRMIRLSGYEPDVDIKVEYTGLRPGEKLYEELLMSEEGMHKTPNKLIYIGSPIEFDEENFIEELEELRVAENSDFGEIRAKLREVVPTYTG